MKIQEWEPLRPGDIIDIVSPGFRADPKQIRKSLEILRAHGYVPRLPKNTNGKDILCCNSDEMRLRLLSQALRAKDSAAIWCMRGGYGAIRLLPGLEGLKRPSRAKPIIGLSDNTILQSFVMENWGWPSIHGPNFERLGRGVIPHDHMAELFGILNGDIGKIIFSRGLRALNSAARSSRKVSGILKGGNLITIQGQVRGPAELKTDGAILFFEDIGERGYRVDRALWLFEQWGYFKKARAVIFGEFSGAEEPGGRKSLVPAVLKRFAERMRIPVVSEFPLGHGPIQRPIAIGGRAELHCGAKPKLIYTTGCRAR